MIKITIVNGLIFFPNTELDCKRTKMKKFKFSCLLRSFWIHKVYENLFKSKNIICIIINIKIKQTFQVSILFQIFSLPSINKSFLYDVTKSNVPALRHMLITHSYWAKAAKFKLGVASSSSTAGPPYGWRSGTSNRLCLIFPTIKRLCLWLFLILAGVLLLLSDVLVTC